MMTRLGLALCAVLLAFATGCHSLGYHCCGHRRPLAIRPFKHHHAAVAAPVCCDSVGYAGPVEIGYPYASGAVIHAPTTSGPVYSGPVMNPPMPMPSPPPMPRP